MVIILYLSGLNMTEGILNKEKLVKIPSKTKEAKLKIMRETLSGSYLKILIQPFTI